MSNVLSLRLTKTSFLHRLETAVERLMKEYVGPNDNRANLARFHAGNLSILVGNKSSLGNPILSFIEYYSTVKDLRPLSLKDLAKIEAAWEYYEKN